VAGALEIGVNDSAEHLQNRFLADLTQAMRSAAEAGRMTDVEQCRADAKAYIEQLHANTTVDAHQLRQESEADIVAIRDRSRTRVELVRQETEQRLTRRRERLDRELAEFHAAVELEIESVQQQVEAFQAEVSQFFEQLLQGADPAVFATMASKMPDAPTFADPDGDAFAAELRAKRDLAERAVRREPNPPAPAAAPAVATDSSAPVQADGDGDPVDGPRGRWWTSSTPRVATQTTAEDAQ